MLAAKKNYQIIKKITLLFVYLKKVYTFVWGLVCPFMVEKLGR